MQPGAAAIGIPEVVSRIDHGSVELSFFCQQIRELNGFGLISYPFLD
jgi:hypothetical protein